MQDKPFHKYYKDEKYDKLSQKVFIRFVVIFFVFYLFVMGVSFAFYQNFSYITIAGKSMQSTLNPKPVLTKTKNGEEYLQDGVYIKHTRDVGYGDIVVLNNPKGNIKESKTIIKRVLGLEGDYVTIVKMERPNGGNAFHLLRVDSKSEEVQIIEENYIYSYSQWSCEDGSVWETIVNGVAYETQFFINFTQHNDYESKIFTVNQLNDASVTFFKVPEKSIFFLGDNRTNSNDSRSLGFFKKDSIEGKVVDIVSDGTAYKGNNFWWFNRIKGFFRVIWKEILYFFGVKA